MELVAPLFAASCSCHTHKHNHQSPFTPVFFWKIDKHYLLSLIILLQTSGTNVMAVLELYVQCLVSTENLVHRFLS